MKTEKLLLIGLLFFVVMFAIVNIVITPDIEVQNIDGENIVVSVDGKSTYRPLTKIDELEGNIIFISK